MRSGVDARHVFPDEARAKAFAAALRRVAKVAEAGGDAPATLSELSGEAGLGALLAATGSTVESVRVTRKRVVEVALVYYDNGIAAYDEEHRGSDGDDDDAGGAWDKLDALVSEVVAAHEGQPYFDGWLELEAVRPRLLALRAEGAHAFGVLATPLEETQFAPRGAWFARVDAPDDLRLRGRWAVDGDGRAFTGDLVKGVLRLTALGGADTPPAWKPGVVVQCVAAEGSSASGGKAPTVGILGRLWGRLSGS